jgi:Icc-related predicted phosphoesterase
MISPEGTETLIDAVSDGFRDTPAATVLRILALADIPPELPDDLTSFLDEQAIDAVISAGDLTGYDLRGFKDLDLPKLGVYGNHCNGKYLAEVGFINLHLRQEVINGVRFAGLEGCVRYKSDPTDVLYTQDEYTALVEQLPGADIVVTHCPPEGINDHDDPAHVGITALRRWIDTHRPTMLVHGHTYPDPPVTHHGATRIEYVCGNRIITATVPAPGTATPGTALAESSDA